VCCALAYGHQLAERRARDAYLTVWIREASGAWRWLLDGGSSSSPAPAP
jgi:hypothetical protein